MNVSNHVNRRTSLKMLTATTTGGFIAPYLFVATARGENLSDLQILSPEEHILGDDNAPVTIIEYASMTCGHCASFHNNIFPTVKEKFIDTGKAKLVFREFPVSTQDLRSIAAFMLARCGEDDKYFPLVSVLFKQQNQWARAENPIPILLNIAKLAGFTQESFNACLKNQEVMNNVLAIRNKASDDYGVSGTPTFFINGKKHVGTATIDEFTKLIEEAM